MPKKFFTEKRMRDLIWDHEVDREEDDDRRWSRYVYSVVLDPEDNKYYRITWDYGLTESQEDYYPEGEYPEVIKNTKVIVERKTAWLEVDQKIKDNFNEEIQSLKVVSDKKELDNAINIFAYSNVDDFIETIEKVKILNHNETMENSFQAVKDYIEMLKRTVEGLK